jgi:hypothetical protein
MIYQQSHIKINKFVVFSLNITVSYQQMLISYVDNQQGKFTKSIFKLADYLLFFSEYKQNVGAFLYFKGMSQRFYTPYCRKSRRPRRAASSCPVACNGTK